MINDGLGDLLSPITPGSPHTVTFIMVSEGRRVFWDQF